MGVMPIEFMNLVDGEDWLPASLTVDSPNYHWAAGGTLADAPVDVAATFADKMWYTTKVQPGFKMNIVRCAPNFMVPRHHHSLREMIVVLGGELLIEYDGEEKGQEMRLRAGQFSTSDAFTPHTMTAGPEGATYFETFSGPMDELEIWWYSEGWVAR